VPDHHPNHGSSHSTFSSFSELKIPRTICLTA
jgi:hypothetical protein